MLEKYNASKPKFKAECQKFEAKCRKNSDLQQLTVNYNKKK